MDNKVLLSQDEIDVLINFLTQKNDKVGGEVLEQGSVDKLLNLLKSGNGSQKLYFDSSISQVKGAKGTAILVLDGEANIGEQQEFCRLECEVDSDTGFIHILCSNTKNGNRYNMTPTCLEQVKYLSGDTTEWGYAVPPLTFDTVATLLQVKYTKATFDMICEIYAERLFGNKKHSIPSMYMPAAQDLIQHLVI